MRELATQAANDTNTDQDREELQKELNQLTSEINRIGNNTEFNTEKILNGGVKAVGGSDYITEATSGKRELTTGLTTGASWDFTAGDKIQIDGKTFDLMALDGSSFATEEDAIKALNNLTTGGAGGQRLSELAELSLNGASLVITSRSTGKDSTVDVVASATSLATAAITTAEKAGTDTTITRQGLEMGNAIDSSATINIAKGTSFELTIGDGKAVKVEFATDKSYAVASGTKAEQEAELKRLVNDINVAIQKAGLGSEVTASLSSANKLQLISETGEDIKTTNTSTVLSGLDIVSDNPTNINVQQVVGSGAQGSGFTATFQIGANKGQSINLNISDMRASALGITGNAGQAGFTSENNVTNGTNDINAEAALDVSTHENAAAAIKIINNAIKTVSSERSKLGAVQNRLEHTINNLKTSSENLTAAESRIRDVDMAKEMMNQTKNSILSQASQAMLAQANQQPQGVLQLLR